MGKQPTPLKVMYMTRGQYQTFLQCDELTIVTDF